MNLLQKFEAKQIADLNKEIPVFRSGDTIKVMVKIVEGTSERLQAFEGLVIRRKNRGLGSTFTVRKTSNGESVERNFLLYSPRVAEIKVVKQGKVRRAKLYYMRDLQGKASRIQERVSFSSNEGSTASDNSSDSSEAAPSSEE
jgi:large subunit ribosomal protein L19